MIILAAIKPKVTIPMHRPGEAPPNQSEEVILDQSLGFGAVMAAHNNPGWLKWAAQAIEPIEGEEDHEI